VLSSSDFTMHDDLCNYKTYSKFHPETTSICKVRIGKGFGKACGTIPLAPSRTASIFHAAGGHWLIGNARRKDLASFLEIYLKFYK
jgi:hypothetical protein